MLSQSSSVGYCQLSSVYEHWDGDSRLLTYDPAEVSFPICVSNERKLGPEVYQLGYGLMNGRT